MSQQNWRMPPHRTGSFYMRTNPVRLPTPARGQGLLAPGLASNPLTTESQLNPTQSPIVKMNGLRLVVAQCFFRKRAEARYFHREVQESRWRDPCQQV